MGHRKKQAVRCLSGRVLVCSSIFAYNIPEVLFSMAGNHRRRTLVAMTPNAKPITVGCAPRPIVPTRAIKFGNTRPAQQYGFPTTMTTTNQQAGRVWRTPESVSRPRVWVTPHALGQSGQGTTNEALNIVDYLHGPLIRSGHLQGADGIRVLLIIWKKSCF